jgi:fatty acid desaturase
MSSDIPYRIEEPDRSLGDLVGDLTSETSRLLRDHVDLAKQEIRTDMRDAARVAASLGAAAVVGVVALVALSLAAGWGLAEVMAPGWAFLIVGGAWTVLAAVLGMAGKRKLDEMDPGPRATIDEIKEDKQWLNTTN